MNKNNNESSIIPISELVENGIYINNKNELIKIKRIFHDRQEIKLYNISEQYNLYLKFSRVFMIKKIQ